MFIACAFSSFVELLSGENKAESWCRGLGFGEDVVRCDQKGQGDISERLNHCTCSSPGMMLTERAVVQPLIRLRMSCVLPPLSAIGVLGIAAH